MITILCAGSRGDYQPYIALAQQLKKMGKEVRITAGKSYADFILNYGIDIFPISADLATVDVDPKLLEAAGSADNPFKMLLTFNKMKEYGVHMAEDYYNACLGSELILYHPGVTMGYFAAEKLGIPSVLASPFPMHKTKEYLSVVMYGKSKKNALNLNISYTMLQGMLWLASSSSLKTFWKKQFGCLPENFGKPYERHTDVHHPAVISCSNYIFERPGDWNPHICQKGYWFVEESPDYAPPKELLEFLAAGESPVYIGFGSMTMTDKMQDLGEMAVEAVKQAGKRCILSGMGTPENADDQIFVIDNIPHTWLFNHVAAVCHHGGAGTSATGFRAGVPSVIIPFSNDQFAWAHRSYDLGIGSRPIPKKTLSVSALADAITYALQPEIVANAKIIGEKIRSEQGAADCAKIILRSLSES